MLHRKAKVEGSFSIVSMEQRYKFYLVGNRDGVGTVRFQGVHEVLLLKVR